ncbi:hypothetical protein K8I28_12180 [bacterium]|nr:hypothetical protein [bacterium]
MEKQDRLFYITSSRNAYEVLARGLLLPMGALENENQVSKNFLPGHLILWQAGIASNYTALMTAEGKDAFPIAFELNEVLSEKIIRLKHSMDTPENENVIVLDGFLPLSSVSGLRFSSDEDRRKFMEGNKSNFYVSELPVTIEEKIFKFHDFNFEESEHILHYVQSDANRVPFVKRETNMLDRVMGAFCMISYMMSYESDQNSVKYIIELSKSLTEKSHYYPYDQNRNYLGVLNRLMMLAVGEEIEQDDEDYKLALLQACSAYILNGKYSETWNAFGAVNVIATDAEKYLDYEAYAQVTKWQENMLAILRGDKYPVRLSDFPPSFVPALVLFILRPDPESLMQSLHSPLEPGKEVLVQSAALTGLHTGFRNLPLDFKGPFHRFEAFSIISAALLNNHISSIDAEIFEPVVIKEVIDQRQQDELHTSMFVTVDDKILHTLEMGPDDSMLRLFYQARDKGYNLQFDRERSWFYYVFQYPDSGRKQKIYVFAGEMNHRGNRTVRFGSVCEKYTRERYEKLVGSHKLQVLLETNSSPHMFCRFAIDDRFDNDSYKQLVVIVDQILETIDIPELQQHIELVAKTADSYEKKRGVDES